MIQLSDHFTCGKLLRYTFPSIVMMVFTSIYGVVDGLFLSNFAGKTALAAVNFIYPFLMILGGIGFMFGSGGSALVAKTLGEGRHRLANRIFTSLFLVSILTGIVLSLFGYAFLRPIACWLGAKGELLEDSLVYGRIYLLGVPASVIQYEFQNLYVTANKPKLGLYSTVASGVTNIVLDAVFVAWFGWGLVGAAVATVMSQYLAGLLPAFYFARKNSSLLRFVRTRIDWAAMLKICTNGASELLNNISMSIVGIIYNIQLLKYAGNDGLAAYGVLMYISFLFVSIFVGYSIGFSPIISFHFGAKNPKEIRSLLLKSYGLIAVLEILMFIISEVIARPAARLFVGYDSGLFAMTLRGFLLYSFSFLFVGFAILGSSIFTALNNGLISAIISFMRTIVFEIALVLILPAFLGLDGVWLSPVFAELSAALLGCFFLFTHRHVYHYARRDVFPSAAREHKTFDGVRPL